MTETDRPRPGTIPGPPPLGTTRAGARAAGRIAMLAGTDFAALLLAATLAVFLWARPIRGQDPLMYLPAVPAAVLIVLAYAQARLYPGFGLGPVEILRRYWLITLAGFTVLASTVFALKIDHVYSRMTLGLALVFSLVLVPAIRWLATRLLRRTSWWAEPVVVFVDAEPRASSGSVLREWSSPDFRTAEVVEVDTRRAGSAEGRRGVLEPAEACAAAGIRIALVSFDRRGTAELMDDLRLRFPRVIMIREFDALPVEVVQVHNLGGVLGLEYGNNLLRRQSRWVKRTLDLGIGGVALVLALPVMLLAVAAVKLRSPGPALFVQPREGSHGRVIGVPKIRTMVPGADEGMPAHLADRPELRDEWEAGFKLRDDPRLIPGVGPLLRRFSIDELPQLWSVVRGDMSLVGPRPFPGYHLEALSERSLHLRRQVRPGLTGLWQVMARGVADVQAQESYDIYYIRNWSLWLDLYILARTVIPVITGRGAY